MKVAQKVRPSIVGIKVEYSANSMFLRNPTTASAEGSGIIISEDGYILTNNHIVNSTSNNSYYEIKKANKVSVYLFNDETEYPATIIGTDEQTDLAVIKIDKTGLTPAELGDSSSVHVGEFSMAIGNPLGMQSSVTAGIISAVDRKVTDSDGKTFTLIQTDAAINSGNSGGALVNAEGKVIGVNTLKLLGTGIEGMGFAIPINSTKDIYEQLIQYNKVKRPYIGITGLDLDQKTADYNKLVVGIYVKDIETFSSAEKAGIKIGDVIIAADGKTVSTMDELNEIKNSHKIGDTIEIKLNRNGSEMTVSVTLAEQP
ncbi:MAG: trypsin-like serine protease [Clostridia bacterium]|nr:trypsin-like serine protease [Clostridia bacterium]